MSGSATPRRQANQFHRCANACKREPVTGGRSWPRSPPDHGAFAYVSGRLADGTTLPLFRLRHAGSASTWGFAIYLASEDGYENSISPSGYAAGTPEEALDCASGLYLNDHTAWLKPPTN